MYAIEHIETTDVPRVMELVGRAIRDMEGKGIEQWDDVYPDASIFSMDAGFYTLRGLFEGAKLIGVFTLNEYQDEEYKDVDWELDDPAPLVLHRLCLDPEYQGKGLAKLILSHVENYARANGYRSIRLDAFNENPASLALYSKTGFEKRGMVRFRKGDFACFEKILDDAPSGGQR